MGESDKRQAILQAALELFADRGFDGTRVPEIATQAKVAAGTLYHYFPSKESMANALYRECLAEFSKVSALEAMASAPVKAQFQEFCERFQRFIFDRTLQFKFLEAHCHERYLDAASQAAHEAFDDSLRALFRRWGEAGALAHHDHDLLFSLTFGGLLGLFKASQHGFAEFDSNQQALAIEHLWNTVTQPVSLQNRSY